MRYAVTLEHGSDGSCLGWVHELPGCFIRGGTREEVEDRLQPAIDEFLAWLSRHGEVVPADRQIEVRVVEEVESLVETSEDTEVLVAADRCPLTVGDWSRIEQWLEYSRRDLVEALEALPEDELDRRAEGSSRTIREELVHIALVEFLYAAWTFDLRSRAGLRACLDWTREIALTRVRGLSAEDEGEVTHAEWAGAPRPEEWTARKAARRLVWHELLHLPALGHPEHSEEQRRSTET